MSKQVSLNELPRYSQVDPQDLFSGAIVMANDLNLPETVDTECIVINMSRLRTLHCVGAIAASVLSEYQGDRSEYTTSINGINSDSTAVGGKSTYTHKADKSSSHLSDPPYLPASELSTYGRPIAIHSVNKAEGASVVSDSVRAGKGREEAWASYLDKAISESIRRFGRDHLTRRSQPFDRILEYGVASVFGAGSYGAYAAESEVAAGVIAAAYGITQGATLYYRSATLKMLTGDMHLSDKRWSIFPADTQLDRYVALNGLSRLPGLIRARP